MAETDLNNKRKEAPNYATDQASRDSKRSKTQAITRKNWIRSEAFPQDSAIQPGDSGIFATCVRNKEGKCGGDLKDLFDDFAARLYGDGELDGKQESTQDIDIEAELRDELKEMQGPARPSLFSNVRLNLQCVVFIKTRTPLEPVSFVQAICDDAMRTRIKRTRYVQRLTPMSVMGKASEAGLEEAATKALRPHFHGDNSQSRRFAIRPNFRNRSASLSRETVIKKVAEIVGPGHKVDLKDFDFVILVEIYQKVCGVSVVDRRYEELKRFNLAEIHDSQSPAGGLG